MVSFSLVYIPQPGGIANSRGIRYVSSSLIRKIPDSNAWVILDEGLGPNMCVLMEHGEYENELALMKVISEDDALALARSVERRISSRPAPAIPAPAEHDEVAQTLRDASTSAPRVDDMNPQEVQLENEPTEGTPAAVQTTAPGRQPRHTGDLTVKPSTSAAQEKDDERMSEISGSPGRTINTTVNSDLQDPTYAPPAHLEGSSASYALSGSYTELPQMKKDILAGLVLRFGKFGMKTYWMRAPSKAYPDAQSLDQTELELLYQEIKAKHPTLTRPDFRKLASHVKSIYKRENGGGRKLRDKKDAS